MSRQIQFRRGTTAEHKVFTGAPGEITVDTTKNTLCVHDGETVGGTPLARATDIPTIPHIPTIAEIAHDAMPGTRVVNLTLGASGQSYTAPGDGWVMFSAASGGAGRVIRLGVPGGVAQSAIAYGANDTLAAYIPVAKGATFQAYYNATGTVYAFRFVYAVGAA